MTSVLVSIGSNVDREHNIRGAVSEMGRLFPSLTLSPVYESIPVGFEGDNFYNLVAMFKTELTIAKLLHALRDIETNFGRRRNHERFGPRTLDLDLLAYGDLVQHSDGINLPRSEITEYTFVIKPLADMCPDQMHPELGKNYQTLWDNYTGNRESIWPVAFDPLAG